MRSVLIPRSICYRRKCSDFRQKYFEDAFYEIIEISDFNRSYFVEKNDSRESRFFTVLNGEISVRNTLKTPHMRYCEHDQKLAGWSC